MAVIVPGFLIGWSADPGRLQATRSPSRHIPSLPLSSSSLPAAASVPLVDHVERPPPPSSPPATTLPGPPCTTDPPPLAAAVLPQPQPLPHTPPSLALPPARSITTVTIPTITPSSRKKKKRATPRTSLHSCPRRPLINRENSRSSVLKTTSVARPTIRISLPMPSLLQVARPPILPQPSTLTLVSPRKPVHPVFFNRPYLISRLRAPPPLRHSRAQMTLTACEDSVLPVQAPQRRGLA